jgi:hypothetical protein
LGGVLIPDHAPQMNCAVPWHAGMAHALGYLRAALQLIEKSVPDQSLNVVVWAVKFHPAG